MIHVSTHVTSNRNENRTVVIDCPRCGAAGVTAACWDQTESLQVVIRKTTTWVRCPVCGITLYSHEPTDQIMAKSPAELHGIVIRRISLISRFAFVVAIVLGVLPMIGAAMAILSLILNWRNGGWLRRGSWIALGVSLATTAAVIALLSSKGTPAGTHH